MAGIARVQNFVSVWNKKPYRKIIRSKRGSVVVVANVQPMPKGPGLDDGQPARGIDRRESDHYDYSPDNRAIWMARITDTVGNWSGVNSFLFERYKGGFVQFNGLKLSNSGQLLWTCSNVCMGAMYVPTDPRTLYPALTSAEKVDMVNRIILATNPSRSVVSVPTAIAELRELPKLLIDSWGSVQSISALIERARNWGNIRSVAEFLKQRPLTKREVVKGVISTLIDRRVSFYTVAIALRKSLREAGNSHLSYRWGVQPLVNDITKLCFLQSSIEARVKHLERLYSKGQTHARVTLPARSEVTTNSALVYLKTTGLDYVRGYRQQVSRERIWGSARWRSKDTRKRLDWLDTKDKRNTLSLRLLTGMTNSEILLTLWELIPNSWLSDWFFGLGSFIEGNKNYLDLIVDNVCIMRSLRTDQKWVITQHPSWLQATRWVDGFYEVKLRDAQTIPVVIPTPGLPILTARKWSIVASLVTSRKPGSRVKR